MLVPYSVLSGITHEAKKLKGLEYRKQNRGSCCSLSVGILQKEHPFVVKGG